MIKAAFFDVDGTMVSFRQKMISDRLREDLLALQGVGVRIFVCTGRSRQDLASTGMLRDVAFDGYVTLNGQCCFDHRGVYRDEPICREDLEGAYRVLTEHPHLAALVQEDGFSFVNRVTPRVQEVFAYLHTEIYPVHPAERMLTDKIYQFVPLVEPGEEELFLPVMPHCTHTRWHPKGIDILPMGDGKAGGIRATLDYYGLAPEEIIAFGDGENDLPMLRMAGIGVAMGNAIPQAKELAQYVTVGVEEDGVSQALRHFGLLPEKI